MSKLVQQGRHVGFWCPACNEVHAINLDDVSGPFRWTVDFEKNTIHPSVRTLDATNCHSYVKNGQIEFLSDSNHAMRGTTVDLPDFPDHE